MAYDSLSVLLRVAAELVDRAARVKRYLEAIGPGETREYEQLSGTIGGALGRIEALLYPTLAAVASSRDPASLQVLLDYLKTFSRWFVTIHELLAYLPRQSVSAETVLILQDGFQATYATQSPSILLGSLFNAAEFDFIQLIKGRLPDLSEIVSEDNRNVVLELAICDRSSPAAWAVLAHELGHAIDITNSVSEQVVDRFITDPQTSVYPMLLAWCRELCADLIAADAVGPSAILSLLSLEYCMYPLRHAHAVSRSHPPTKWRLALIADHLKRSYSGEDFLAAERIAYDVAWTYSVERAYSEVDKALEAKERDEETFKNVIVPVWTELHDVVRSLALPHHTISQVSVNRCLRRLRSSVPISAQGASREMLRRRLAQYARRRGGSTPGAFQALTKEFTEGPLASATILTAAHLARLESIDRVITRGSDGSSPMATADGTTRFAAELARFDELVASSVRTSAVHRQILERHASA